MFTSSAAGFIPNPFAVCYGLTKAGVSEFAASLAVEARARGIHAHAIQPSPVNSQFTKGGGNKVEVAKLDMFDAAYKNAVEPDSLPNQIFGVIGRGCVLADLGGVAIGMRLGVTMLGLNAMTFGFALVAPLLPDYKNNDKKN